MGHSQGDGRIWAGVKNYRVKIPAFLQTRTRWLVNGFPVRSSQRSSLRFFFFSFFYDMISYIPIATSNIHLTRLCFFF